MLKKKKMPGWNIVYSQRPENPEIPQALLNMGDFVKLQKKPKPKSLKSIFILQNICLYFCLQDISKIKINTILQKPYLQCVT